MNTEENRVSLMLSNRTVRAHLIAVIASLYWSASFARADTIHEYLTKAAPVSITQHFTANTSSCGTIRFTSHTWQGQEWVHPLYLCAPKKILYPDSVLIRVTGSGEPSKYASELQQAADQSGAYTACLGSVPNQPLFDGRKEDRLLAFSFEKYRETGDPSWPVLLPMVTSVVRALDVIETEVKKRHQVPQLRAVVTGASKRGWTTYLSAVADRRVIGIAPAVFDMLDMPRQVSHAREVYGADSRMIKAYTELGLTNRIKEPRMQELVRLIDPYAYRQALTLPKLILLGTNDPYWVVDSFLLYEKGLPPPTLLSMQPNEGHGALGTEKGLKNVATWFSLLAAKEEIPNLTFSLSIDKEGGSIAGVSSAPVQSIALWSADSDDRDFRLTRWNEDAVVGFDPQKPIIPFSRPRYGMRGVLVEATLKTSKGTLMLSSPAYVIPPQKNRAAFAE